jgi:hypothetical protein
MRFIIAHGLTKLIPHYSHAPMIWISQSLFVLFYLWSFLYKISYFQLLNISLPINLINYLSFLSFFLSIYLFNYFQLTRRFFQILKFLNSLIVCINNKNIPRTIKTKSKWVIQLVGL